MPEGRFIPLETIQKILDLAQNGAEIIFENNFPNDVPGLFNLNERQETYRKLKIKIKFISHGETVRKFIFN
ncbi:MAG: hypothetical protein IPH62_00365 [Ignavibacteriae bacterium]|nr:hypothetical protein [Ignavibacteriota bacterium]